MADSALKPLTPKRLKFVDEYMKDNNATQACIRAGYSKNSATVLAAGLLADVSVQARIAIRREKMQERTEITADMIVQRWWQMASANPNDLVEYRWVCCRFCHGVGHSYQWADLGEYLAAEEQHKANQKLLKEIYDKEQC